MFSYVLQARKCMHDFYITSSEHEGVCDSFTV